MTDLGKLIRALDFAAKKHTHHHRENGDPYINHLIEVAAIISQSQFMDSEHYRLLLSAALLHDILENTDTTYDELSLQFGPYLANIVKECTDDMSLSKQQRKQQQIEHAENVSLEAKIVKLADKISNLQFRLSNPDESTRGYVIWSYFVYEALKKSRTSMPSHLFQLAIVPVLENRIQAIFIGYGIIDSELRIIAPEELRGELEEYYKML